MKIRSIAIWIAVLVALSGFGIVGCDNFPESTFQLASESRLPKWITLPPGLTRADVSLTMNYYVMPWGRTATFLLQDKKNQVLEKVHCKVRGSEPVQLKNPQKGFDPGYPAYEVITANGITEIIEHRKMEPRFYVNDDPSVCRAISTDGCG